MLSIRKLREREIELSDLLKSSEFNLEESVKTLHAESRARQDAVQKADELERSKKDMECSLCQLQDQIQTYVSEQFRLKNECYNLEEVIKKLNDEKSDLKLKLAHSEKRIAEQSLEVGVCPLSLSSATMWPNSVV